MDITSKELETVLKKHKGRLGICCSPTQDLIAELETLVVREAILAGRTAVTPVMERSVGLGETPPVETPKPVLKANVRGGDGKLTQVQYTKRFVASGFTFFLHGKRGAWTVSSWDCGLKLGDFPTVKAGIDKAKSLTPRDIVNVQGAISLHKWANTPVKKETKS